MAIPLTAFALILLSMTGMGLAAPDASTLENSAVIPVPKLENDSYDWWKRHEEVLRIKGAVNPEIVLIGDSITHFWAGEPKSNHANGPHAWDSAFGKSRTLNLGFGWDRTKNVLWRIDHGELDGLKPGLVVIHIGTNNTSQTKNARQNTAPEIAAGVLAVCEGVRKKLPNTKIVLMAVFPREEKPDHPRRKLIGETNLLLADMAREKGFVFLDIGPKLLTPDGILTKELAPDFCHPTEKGYQIWADALQPFIQSTTKP